MDEMYQQKLLSLVELEAAYDAMLAAQRRLPESQIRRQINRLKKQARI